MQVILLERVAKLGQMGEVVDVKPATHATICCHRRKRCQRPKPTSQLSRAKKPSLRRKTSRPRAEAEAWRKTDGQQFIVIRSASDAGALYGSVTTRDAAEAQQPKAFTVDRKQVVLIAPIKILGVHDVHVVLHPEVDATIELNVARSVEEAELQASGKSIQELAAEEEAAAEFEIQELFDDIGSAASDDDDLANRWCAHAGDDAAEETPAS